MYGPRFKHKHADFTPKRSVAQEGRADPTDREATPKLCCLEKLLKFDLKAWARNKKQPSLGVRLRPMIFPLPFGKSRIRRLSRSGTSGFWGGGEINTHTLVCRV